MKLDLPVMLMLLVGAASLQTLTPALPGTFLKAPLLPAAALYYVLTRPPLLALVAALWAGILTDALGGATAGTSAFFLLAAALLLLALRRVLHGELWPTAMAMGAAVSMALAVAQWLAMRTPNVDRPGWGLLGMSLLVTGVAGAVAAAGFKTLGHYLDVWAGNIKIREEITSG